MPQRKRPWQAVTSLSTLDRNEVRTRSFIDYRAALAYGIEWLQTMGPGDPRMPSVHVTHRDHNSFPEGELRPETYRLEWMSEHQAILQTTWPSLTPKEERKESIRAMGSVTWDEAGTLTAAAPVRRLVKVLVVAPGGEERAIGLEFEL